MREKGLSYLDTLGWFLACCGVGCWTASRGSLASMDVGSAAARAHQHPHERNSPHQLLVLRRGRVRGRLKCPGMC